jgi:hypothetical protein
MLPAMRLPVLVFLLAAAGAACDSNTLEPLPFQVTVEASRTTAAPGDTVNFLVVTQGGSLIGVQMDYGDAMTDQFGTSGARTARVSFRHAFATQGTFTVRATVTDAQPPSEKSATIDVRVQ